MSTFNKPYKSWSLTNLSARLGCLYLPTDINEKIRETKRYTFITDRPVYGSDVHDVSYWSGDFHSICLNEFCGYSSKELFTRKVILTWRLFGKDCRVSTTNRVCWFTVVLGFRTLQIRQVDSSTVGRRIDDSRPRHLPSPSSSLSNRMEGDSTPTLSGTVFSTRRHRTGPAIRVPPEPVPVPRSQR